MTRLQYSGRKHSSSSTHHDWKRPGNSKKWVRTDDNAVLPPPQAAKTRSRHANTTTNWGTHSWKRPEEPAGEVQAPLSLPLKETTTSFSENVETSKPEAAVESSAPSISAPSQGSRNNLILQRNDAIEPPKDNYVKHKKNSLRLVRGELKPQGDAVVDETEPLNTTAASLQNPDSSAVCKYSRTAPSKKRKRPPPAKRINVESAGDDSDEKVDSSEGDEEGKNAKMLTDFAYRETKSRTRGKGLVRVQQDSAKICPTFLQGVDCTNVRCMKRHDVPAELAMPICSFFQRKGMCLKEDCKFRHVKVSVGALNCPNFERKGYCDDPSCKLMHQNRKRAPLANQQKRSVR